MISCNQYAKAPRTTTTTVIISIKSLILRNKIGISFETGVKKIRNDGNLKMVTFQVSRDHYPLELVFGETNSNIIEKEDWQEGDQVVVKIERISK
jgi:hypothetical protein